ncbi:hypothetical protein F5876DRAFT_77733 [Lentinula aff. lateritia]|uniref:Uncharacterized protein n=1 Tax=Lentinula aff. lateritia TaxID=2804960 RepID=A0ACC1TXM0_9AGAR|nr:hypothetical protein F5876DRAFT_77733 [Lentinula aff. lateritia]
MAETVSSYTNVAEVENFIRAGSLISYFLVSNIALFIYDLILIFPAELKFVWSPDIFAMFNVLYFLQRYMPFGSLILLLFFDGVLSLPISFNSNGCMTLYIMSGLTFAVGICGCQVVLIWRVWTLWNYSAKMTFILTGLFLCGSVFNLVIFISTRTTEGYPGPSATSVVHCASQRYVQPLFFLFWVFLTAYHAGILLLMFIPQGYSLRVYIWALSLSRAVVANYSREVRMRKWAELINLINDIGIVYSISLLAGALRLPANFQGLLISFQHVMETILTSRAIIHWKRRSHKSQTTTALDLTGTSFATPHTVFEPSNRSAPISPHRPSFFRGSGSTSRYSLEELLLNVEDSRETDFVNGNFSLDTLSQNNVEMGTLGSLYSELMEDGNPGLFSPSPSRESDIIRRSLSIITPSIAPSEFSDNGDGPSGGNPAGEMGSSRDTMQTSSSYETLPSYHTRVSGPRRSSSRIFSYIPPNRSLPPLPQHNRDGNAVSRQLSVSTTDTPPSYSAS